ncbi:hypothetical protein ACLQ3C_04325 [Gordonia sp. DT30]|uniref:hypothetical protein n=1 Tax=Gordonia sp. DT30 TaxID=3416546 RepID=UPI003CF131FC
MIPSRKTFDTWQTDSVGEAGHTLRAAGDTFEEMVSTAWYAMLALGKNRLWTGVAQQSGESAFTAGKDRAEAVGAIADNSAIGIARYLPDLVGAAASIRKMLTIIESGDLFVTDDWIVLPRVKRYSAPMAKTLATVADNFQVRLNPLLVDLSQADLSIAVFIRDQLNSRALGIALPEIDADPHAPADFTTAPRGDNTGGTNPTVGRGYQRARLAEHMMGTVVDTTTTASGATTTTTLRMLDGSRQIYTGGPGVNKTEFFDPRGVLTATRTVAGDGTATVTLTRPGKPPAVVTERPDGTTEAVVDGITFSLPSSRDYTLALASGGMAATESQVTQGLPYLTQAEVARLKMGAKLAGPGLTLLGTAVGVATAEDSYQRCVAGVTGAVGLTTDLTMIAAPEAAPVTAAVRAVVAGLSAAVVGNLVGQVVCK